MSAVKFGHCGLTVADLERSKSFFSEIFGFEPFFEVRRKTPWLAAQVGYLDADISFCHMRGAGGMHLEFLKYHAPESHPHDRPSPDTFHPGNMHLSLLVDDIQLTISKTIHWRSLHDAKHVGLFCFFGNAHDLDATTVPDGPNKGDKGFYMRDPDGHSIEVIQKAAAPKADIEEIISRMEEARARNNKNWMDVVRTIYRLDPAEGHRLFQRIEEQDREISAIAAESHR